MTNEEDKAISLQEAINAMQALQDEDVEAYGVHIPECFDGDRAIEALKQLKPVGRAEKAGREQKNDRIECGTDGNPYKLTISNGKEYKQESKTGWIPVSERLPKKNIAVLTYVSTGPSQTYCLAYWNDVRNGWEEWIGYELIEKDRGYKVLAWQPLPKPYKAESEE